MAVVLKGAILFPHPHPQGHLTVSGDVFLVFTAEVVTYCMRWVETGDAATHPSGHRAAP